jgi:hypothetical protein
VSLLVVLLVAAIALALFFYKPGKRDQVKQLLEEVGRTEDEEELAQAEEEVRDLNISATPEDAAEVLPDWGPGVPRRKRRS